MTNSILPCPQTVHLLCIHYWVELSLLLSSSFLKHILGSHIQPPHEKNISRLSGLKFCSNILLPWQLFIVSSFSPRGNDIYELNIEQWIFSIRFDKRKENWRNILESNWEFEYVAKSNMSSISASFPIVTTADWKLYFGKSEKKKNFFIFHLFIQPARWER